MFNLNGVFAHFRRAKQPDAAATQKYPAEVGPYKTRQEFEAKERHRDAMQRGIDELVSQLSQEART